LPASATSQLVFATARAHAVQIRELGVRRESVEAAFLRVLGDDGAVHRDAPYRTQGEAEAEAQAQEGRQ
ncbi:MAG TPA: hypothetical protein VIX73_02390, partial [Kofleriaceae bacterium]